MKKKVAFHAERAQLERIEALLRSGEYRSTSDFLRQAVDEKLEGLRRRRLEKQLARYCAEGYAHEDRDLVRAQAFESDES